MAKPKTEVTLMFGTSSKIEYFNRCCTPNLFILAFFQVDDKSSVSVNSSMYQEFKKIKALTCIAGQNQQK